MRRGKEGKGRRVWGGELGNGRRIAIVLVLD